MVAALDLGAALGIGAPALAARARALLARLGLPVDYERRFDARRWRGLTSTRSGAGRPSVSSSVPPPGKPGSWRFAPADIASHLVASRCGRAKA